MLSPELEEQLSRAKLALDEAACDNIIELCKRYLVLLTLYRAELYQLPDKLNLRSGSSLKQEEIVVARKAVRAAIEQTTQERNQTEALLLSFTAVSGYEAMETLNREKYQGQNNWELRAGGIFCRDSPGKRMSVQEAVEVASLLRREAHIARAATRSGALVPGLFNSEPD
jgi:hypothetical protein